jgi:large subunit ribosomal protein L6
MSRIGKKPVGLPSGVTASVSGQTIEVKGPKRPVASPPLMM